MSACVLKAPALGKTDKPFVLSVTDELRIELQHFKTPWNQVFDSATGTVIAGAKLKIVHRIGGLIPRPPVMDSFSREKFAPKELLHDVTVLKHFMEGLPVSRRKPEDGVPALDASRDLRQPVLLAVDLAHPLVFALPRAKVLLTVDSSAPVPAGPEKILAAIRAGRRVFNVGVCTPALIRTGHRAVKRVLAEFFPVGFQGCRFVKKRRSAVFTRELSFLRKSGGSPVDGLVDAHAGFAAKLTVFFPLSRCLERIAALKACTNIVVRGTGAFQAFRATKALMPLCRANGKGGSALFAVLNNGHIGYSCLKWHWGEYPICDPVSTYGAK